MRKTKITHKKPNKNKKKKNKTKTTKTSRFFLSSGDSRTQRPLWLKSFPDSGWQNGHSLAEFIVQRAQFTTTCKKESGTLLEKRSQRVTDVRSGRRKFLPPGFVTGIGQTSTPGGKTLPLANQRGPGGASEPTDPGVVHRYTCFSL